MTTKKTATRRRGGGGAGDLTDGLQSYLGDYVSRGWGSAEVLSGGGARGGRGRRGGGGANMVGDMGYYAAGGGGGAAAKKPRRPKVKSVTLVGKAWFRKSAGNSYQTVQIIVNGETVAKLGPTSGYGSYYEQIANDWLAENGYIDNPDRGHAGRAPLWQVAQDKKFAYDRQLINVPREKDL